MIHAEHLSRTFPGDPPVVALNDATFEVESGEFVAVVGPSGSGKSTLFHLLGLLDRPTEGFYRIDGVDVATLDNKERAMLRARNIGFVFQSFHLIATRSALENVMLGTLYAGNRADRKARSLDLLERVGLAHRRNANPPKLSGGERQRVAIARALINQPALLLCDEPTGNLDSGSRDEVLGLMRELCSGGVTVMTITHDPVVAGSADRQLDIADGVLVDAAMDGDRTRLSS